MNLLPQTYLLGLAGLLAIAAVVVGRQLLRVRRDESQLQQLNNPAQPSLAAWIWNWTVQLRKRLYQATATQTGPETSGR